MILGAVCLGSLSTLFGADGMLLNRFRLVDSFSPLFHGTRPRISSTARFLSVLSKRFLSVLSKHSMATVMGRRLEGKTILISGASSGIGESIGYKPPETRS